MEIVLVKVYIVKDEWYFTHDGVKVITPPTFVDASSSAVIGENTKVEVASTEQELLNKIVELNLITEEITNN